MQLLISSVMSAGPNVRLRVLKGGATKTLPSAGKRCQFKQHQFRSLVRKVVRRLLSKTLVEIDSKLKSAPIVVMLANRGVIMTATAMAI